MRRYIKRSFGFLLDETVFHPPITGSSTPEVALTVTSPRAVFVEGTFFTTPEQPHAVQIEGAHRLGRGLQGDGQSYVEYDGLQQLVTNLEWQPPAVEAFVKRIQRVLDSR